jgi:DNA-binding NtrC family response regulator
MVFVLLKPTMSTKMPTSPILLVGNDAIHRETIADILKNENLDVIAISSVDGPTNTLRQKKPPFDLVITDLTMPKEDGLEVIDTALKCNPNCSILVLSTFSSADYAVEAITHGAYSIITMPLHLDHFKNALRKFVERSVLLSERNHLRDRVVELESKIESLESAKARMEMLAQQIEPMNSESRANSLDELEHLASLRYKGILTEEQFQSVRKSLLTRWLP